jgi:hypothetical protein
MKNITISVPDDVYRNARIAAARLDTSVSALVGKFLKSMSIAPAPIRAARLAMTLYDEKAVPLRKRI